MRQRTSVPAACCFALLAGLTLAPPARAQSLFATRGLGLPIRPLDARARALGGIGTGLFGINTSLINPADAIGLRRRAIGATVQSMTGQADLNGDRGDFSATRFPTVRMMIPLRTRFALSIGYGSVLEQSWGLQMTGEEEIGGEMVETHDLIEADGGVSRVEIGLAYSVVPNLSVGIAGGIYTGQLERSIRRTFVAPELNLVPFEQTVRFAFSGPHATLGARWDPAPVLRVAGALTLGDRLEVDVKEGQAAGQDWKLPVQLNAGASGLLTPQLALALGIEYDWGADATPIVGESVRDNTWRVGGGLEFIGIETSAHTFPVRLGYFTEKLPYHQIGEAAATEHTLSLGLGMGFGALGGGSPNASIDAGFERGTRSGLESERNPGGLSESFWRLTFSLTLLGL